MKKAILIPLILLAAATLCNAGTWVIHGCKDNYTGFEIQVNSLDTGTSHYSYEFYWDYDWDVALPESADSGTYYGIYENGVYIWSQPTGYSDSLSFSVEVNSPDFIAAYSMWTSGPYPNYYNCRFSYWVQNVTWSEPGPFAPGAGEYWIDFDSIGNDRVSTYQPADFGKWAWDGSINPSWVEPVAPVKKHGKGHTK